MDIRKTIMIKETIEADSVGEVCDPITRVVAVAVIQNPFAGRFIEDLSPLFDIGGQLGERLSRGCRKNACWPTSQLRQGSHHRHRKARRLVRFAGCWVFPSKAQRRDIEHGNLLHVEGG